MATAKNSRILRTIPLLIVAFFAGTTNAKYGGGSGEPNDPYLIYTAEQMISISQNPGDWDKHFRLTNNLDFSDVNLADYMPIGGNDVPFQGVFDGNDHSITGFRFTPSIGDNVGLFGIVDGGAHIKNLTMIDPNVVGLQRVGALVAQLKQATVTRCIVQGGKVSGPEIIGLPGMYIGGLIGSNLGGTVADCNTTCDIPIGTYSVGGLVGENLGAIRDCSATGTVGNVKTPMMAGGLVGWNKGSITGCRATGNVFGKDHETGGLVGLNEGTITHCYATGSASGEYSVGGLAGDNRSEGEQVGTIIDCYATGPVNASKSLAGGLAGANAGVISGCYATGRVIGKDEIGGLVGSNEYIYLGSISNSYATGSITGEKYVGGLVGINPGTVSHCYATGPVSGLEEVGGLIGRNRSSAEGGNTGTVIACFWNQDMSGQDISDGGFGKSTDQMQDPNTYLDAGWDFVGETANGTEDIWWINEGQDYPRLWWQPRKYGGGTGDPNDPYLIYTAEQLNTIGLNQEDADKHFRLMVDIDLSAYKGDTFNRIGCYEPPPQFPSGNIPFTGVFDGNGHTISNFTYVVDINEPPYEGYSCEDFVGLFGYVNGPGAQIKNLGLIDPNIYPEATCSERVARVGALAGRLRLGVITNCYVQGGRVLADAYVGGLVGSNLEGTISNCYATCDVALAEERWLRPIDDPNIPVISVGFSFGGLVGYSRGWIYDCYAAGSVQGARASGGLVGRNDSDIFNPESDIGLISGSYATGDVYGDEDVGGLVGNNSGEIHQCRAFGNVSGLKGVGGLVGDMTMDEGSISDSYATGDVSGNEQVGGLVGYSNGSIQDSYAISEVSGTIYVGGLAGFNGSGTINCSYAGGKVSGIENVGGLVGRNGKGTIYCSYALGGVLGTEYVGGLAGTNFKTIHCSYSAGAVSGIQKVGGLVGDNWGDGTVTSCLWDIETSGLINMCGIESSGATGCDDSDGKTTIEMQTESTFLDAGWDFVGETANGTEDIWWILEGQDYPRLWWELIGE